MIAIVDYGMGNLRSVQKAFEYLGFDAQLTEDKKTIKAAQHVVLPGVGAFEQAMQRLNETGLSDTLRDVAKSGKPLMGICLGMQLMFQESHENGQHQGLGIFEGQITRLPDCGLKIPHIGWNDLETRECTLFKHGENPYVYFVHSYALMGIAQGIAAATCEYGQVFTASVCRDNVMATQFHPEKSGEVGLEMLKRFATFEGGK